MGYVRTAPRATVLGSTGPDELGRAAQAVLASLPAGSGVNPWSTSNPPPARSDVSVVDTVWGGNRYVPYYWANPIPDPSGLIEWIGSDSANKVSGLSQAEMLAADVLLAGGDSSYFTAFQREDVETYDARDLVDPNALGYQDPASQSVRYQEMAAPEFDERGNRIRAEVTPSPAPEAAPISLDVERALETILTKIDQAGGDTRVPTAIVDQATGETLALVNRAPNGGVEVAVPQGGARFSLEDLFKRVTGFVDQVGKTAEDVSDEAKRIANAVRGGAAGAQAGYRAPVDMKPLLYAGGAALAIYAGSRLIKGRR